MICLPGHVNRLRSSRPGSSSGHGLVVLRGQSGTLEALYIVQVCYIAQGRQVMSKTNRRNFVKASAVAAGAAATLSFPTIVSASRGANERIRVGLVGWVDACTRMWEAWRRWPSPITSRSPRSATAIRSKLDSAGKDYPELANLKLKTYTDQRKLFEDKSIDAISFSTQDHWHALQTIWACQAGKHVYVEKPPTWCIWEGRKMVEAARKYGCMVQVGTQNRSSPNIREGIQKLQEGVIGKLYMARAIVVQAAREPGQAQAGAGSAGARLGRLGWSGETGRVQRIPSSALVLAGEFRQRRLGESAGARRGQGSLGAGTERASRDGHVHGRSLRARRHRRRRYAQYAGVPLQMGRQQCAGDGGESALVHQQRSADARQVPVHGSESVSSVRSSSAAKGT